MDTLGFDPDLLRALELAGIFVAAISGALLAVRKQFDIVGVATLAAIAGLGGAVTRDVIIGATPPVAFREIEYLLMPLAAALLTFVAHVQIERIQRSILVFDAAALGLFAVTGTVKALAFGIEPFAAVLLGTITAVGGGLLRDVCAREVPVVFRADSELYALPVVLGATIIAVAWELEAYGAAIAALAAGTVFAIRLLAIRYRILAPRP